MRTWKLTVWTRTEADRDLLWRYVSSADAVGTGLGGWVGARVEIERDPPDAVTRLIRSAVGEVEHVRRLEAAIGGRVRVVDEVLVRPVVGGPILARLLQLALIRWHRRLAETVPVDESVVGRSVLHRRKA